MLCARSIFSTVALALLVAGSAQALPLAEKSPEQQHRKDIAKQGSKYGSCLAKAWEKCEKKGTDPFLAECGLVTGTVAATITDPKVETALQTNIAKCVTKLDFMKKAPFGTNPNTAAVALGCPGGLDDLDDYQGLVVDVFKVAVDQFGLIPTVSGCPNDDNAAKCVFAEVKRLNKLTQGLGKCYAKCENDYKDKKGNGGGTESSDNCSAGGRCVGGLNAGATCFADANCNSLNCDDSFSDPNFRLCSDKALAKAIKKTPWPSLVEALVLPAVLEQLNGANDATYNIPANCP
jgi:hypothetical protein